MCNAHMSFLKFKNGFGRRKQKQNQLNENSAVESFPHFLLVFFAAAALSFSRLVSFSRYMQYLFAALSCPVLNSRVQQESTINQTRILIIIYSVIFLQVCFLMECSYLQDPGYSLLRLFDLAINSEIFHSFYLLPALSFPFVFSISVMETQLFEWDCLKLALALIFRHDWDEWPVISM